MSFPAQPVAYFVTSKINFNIINNDTINISQENKSQHNNIINLCTLIKNSTNYSIIIDGLVSDDEITINKNKTLIDNLYENCKKLGYKYYLTGTTVILSKSYQDKNHYPDLSPNELVVISKDISTIFNSVWKYEHKNATTSSIFRSIAEKLSKEDRESLDSDKGLIVRRLSPEIQRHITEAILYNEFGTVNKSWLKIYETISNIENSEISLQEFKEFDTLKISTPIAIDNYPLYKNRINPNKVAPDYNMSTLDNAIKENNINNFAFMNNIGSHFATIFIQKNHNDAILNYSKANNWQASSINSTIIPSYKISRKPIISIKTNSDIGPAILDRMSISMRDFIFSKPTLQSQGFESTNQKPVGLDQRINAKLEELSTFIYQKFSNPKVPKLLKYKDLNEKDKKIITDYIFFFWLNQSRPKLSNLVSPSKYITDPLNTTIYRKKDTISETFTIRHPDFGLFSVRSRIVNAAPTNSSGK